MVLEKPQVAEKSEKYARDRADATAVLKLRLVEDAREVERLDLHIQEFLAAIKTDAKNHDALDLTRHAKSFEQEILDELDYLFTRTKQDIALYQDVLSRLSEFRSELRDLLRDEQFTGLAQSELSYADLLSKNAWDKVDTLHVLFKKLRTKR